MVETMKSLVAILVGIFILLQYKLWFDGGGLSEVWHLRTAIATQTTENTQLKQRNDALSAEVSDLKHGQAAIEERARSELSMTKSDEAFYQVVEK